MVDFAKLDMTNIWATTGAKTAPDAAKIASGWGIEIVPRQWWNWMQNRLDTNVAYLLQKGIPEWDSTTEYIASKSYATYLGVVYKCMVTHTGSTTPNASANWKVAFAESTPMLSLLGQITPTNSTVPFINASLQPSMLTVGQSGVNVLASQTPLAARTTISAQEANANLTYLSAQTAATNMLPYFSSGTTMATTYFSDVGRSVVAAVTTTDVNRYLGTWALTMATVTTNANTLAEAGRTYNMASNATNIPAAVPGFLRVKAVGATAGTRVLQEFQSFETPSRKWERFSTDAGTWNNWSRTDLNVLGTAAYANLQTSQVDDGAGKVMISGAAGWMGTSVVGTNANSAVTSGFHCFSTGATNTPTTFFNMLSSQYGSDTRWQTQLGWQVGGNKMYFRSILRDQTSSTPWGQLYNDQDQTKLITDVRTGLTSDFAAKAPLNNPLFTTAINTPVINGTTSGGVLVVNGDTVFNAKNVILRSDNNPGYIFQNSVGALRGSLILNSTNSNLEFSAGGTSYVMGNDGWLTVPSKVVTPYIGPSTGALTVQSSMFVTGATIAVRSATSTYQYFSFQNNDGVCSEIYNTGTGGVTVLTVGGTGVFTFQNNGVLNSTGGFSTGGSVAATTNVTAGGNVIATGTVQAGGGTGILYSDGNITGTQWGSGSSLAAHLPATYVKISELGSRSSAIGAGTLGSYVLAKYVGAGGVGPGVSAAGADLRWSNATGGINASPLTGTWRCHGQVIATNDVTLWQRIA